MTYATDLALVRAVLLPEFMEYVGGEPGNGEVLECEARESATKMADAVLAALDQAHMSEQYRHVGEAAAGMTKEEFGVALGFPAERGSQYPDPVLSPQMKALDDTLPCLRHDPVVAHGQTVCRRCGQVRNRATQKWPHPQGPPSSLDSGDGCKDERPSQHHW